MGDMIMFRLSWVFKNGHVWHRVFDSKAEAEAYIVTIDAKNDPNIADIRIDEVPRNWCGGPLTFKILGLIA